MRTERNYEPLRTDRKLPSTEKPTVLCLISDPNWLCDSGRGSSFSKPFFLLYKRRAVDQIISKTISGILGPNIERSAYPWEANGEMRVPPDEISQKAKAVCVHAEDDAFSSLFASFSPSYENTMSCSHDF